MQIYCSLTTSSCKGVKLPDPVDVDKIYSTYMTSDRLHLY